MSRSRHNGCGRAKCGVSAGAQKRDALSRRIDVIDGLAEHAVILDRGMDDVYPDDAPFWDPDCPQVSDEDMDSLEDAKFR